MSYKNNHSRAVVTKEETSQRRAVFLLQDVLISAVKVNILTRLCGILNVSVQLSAGPKSTLYVSVQVSLQTFIMKVSSQPTLSVFEL